MGKHTRAQITEPITSGAEPFWAGPPEWILQRQIHRGEDTGQEVRRPRATITINKQVHMVGGCQSMDHRHTTPGT